MDEPSPLGKALSPSKGTPGTASTPPSVRLAGTPSMDVKLAHLVAVLEALGVRAEIVPLEFDETTG